MLIIATKRKDVKQIPVVNRQESILSYADCRHRYTNQEQALEFSI